jgi:hypothetical protein
VVRVKFRTAGGVVRSIDVPTAQYTPDNVRSMIDAEAQATDDIANL